jgi:hypothetical protein
MPAFRATYFYNQFNQGWTETWYLTEANITNAVTAADQLCVNLVAPRSQHTILLGYRISQVDPPLPRKGVHVSRNLPGSRPDPVVGVENEDLVSVAALFSAFFIDLSHRVVMLRGLADPDTGRNPVTGVGQLAPACLALFNLLEAQLAAQTAQIRRYSNAPTDGVAVTKVQADPANGQFTQLIGPGTPPFNVGDTVHFTGVPRKDLPWLKGQWTVKASALGQMSIAYPFPNLSPILPVKLFAWPSKYVYSSFNTWNFEDLRKRSTGRPTNLVRGRASGIRFRR